MLPHAYSCLLLLALIAALEALELYSSGSQDWRQYSVLSMLGESQYRQGNYEVAKLNLTKAYKVFKSINGDTVLYGKSLKQLRD